MHTVQENYLTIFFFLSEAIPLCVSNLYNILCTVNTQRGPGSSVGIATELRAGRSGIESRWGRDFPPVQAGPEAH